MQGGHGGEEEGRGVDGPVLGACFLVCPSGWFVGFGGRGVSSSSVFFAFPHFFPRQCRFIVTVLLPEAQQTAERYHRHNDDDTGQIGLLAFTQRQPVIGEEAHQRQHHQHIDKGIRKCLHQLQHFFQIESKILIALNLYCHQYTCSILNKPVFSWSSSRYTYTGIHICRICRENEGQPSNQISLNQSVYIRMSREDVQRIINDPGPVISTDDSIGSDRYYIGW